ncbi:hypothetical protein [Hymenobacter pini]|uniref:hypothetical protein n=1 Tax=Hymenobacter pini TaxID=2880879 RepID=UPI001CF57C79|nr:hypothetical protein [Hymenobacter pini]MCA8832149.1 hypothetical protein [Hymenobacter pini]
MKKTLHALLLVSVLNASATAATHPVHRKVTKVEQLQKSAGKDAAELQARSLQLTCYLTDMLRLNSQQAAEVRRATLRELQEQQALTGNQALAHYDACLLRILSAGQYSTFRWLEDRQPVSGLLQSPLTVGSAQR